ncbi:MAG: hypothetical protein D8M57_13255 [Candidatus Scalindua sp. AMX11]|nr:MAG: hypothetical protein DWQ00_11835 [Candidatus Scalindua sp.]NOG83757.1 hypothetical protein [Planctomycetota bacterium]RZV82916.1 MAG: hypothetical protein EX341_08990 [Candidatus Scalindua sp. SCAELEC01]TDE64462.1 MAG: hypothetical protein D8M57_13255 [Candidatus Scalindua sp. AMX11]GJQ59791.1 MAG: hypothetical protein SCALA701_25920 [Candidatus Scalindua sp.]
MTIDVRNNFGKVTVSIGYDASATSITLTSGHGANLPSTFDYNLVWYNWTDYKDPADDPNVEIVRVTNRVTDTLTVTRAQEGTTGTTKNTASKTYKMALAVTKKMVDDIETDIATASGKKLKNLIINPMFEIGQRGTVFDASTTFTNDDDTYLSDRYILLSDGNDIVDVTHQTDGGVSGNDPYVRFDVETISKKFGYLQVIENANLKEVLGGNVSFSFEARVSDATKLSDIRAVVLAWDSTVDTVTSDVVSAWNAEGAVITPATNWTAENVAADLGVTATWARYTIENISIDTASAVNVAIFIYSNDVATNDTLGSLFEMTKIQLEPGTVATPFEYRDIEIDIAKAQRHFVKTYNIDVDPGTIENNGSMWAASDSSNSASSSRPWRFAVEMFAEPVITFYSPGTGATGKCRRVDVTPSDIDAVTLLNTIGTGGMMHQVNAAVVASNRYAFHMTAEAEL